MSDDIMYIVIRRYDAGMRLRTKKSCPVCEESIDYAAEKVKYCPFCGQRLQYPYEELNCAGCGIKRIKADNFCRKCGHKHK